MPRNDLIQRIVRFNAGRDPERLALKYRAMREDAFAFYRGTCHLFYQDWPARTTLDNAPLAWGCGDLHFENFGSYKGDNRLVYFDLNDFDEAALLPASWELARFLVSVMVGAETLGVDGDGAPALCERFLDAYCAALRDGKARWIERATAEGMVEDLLDGLKQRSRKKFIAQRTLDDHGQRKLLIDGKKTLPVSRREYRRVARCMDKFAAGRGEPEFFQVLDVARRISGLGSLGVERYAILVAGKGGPDGHYLLDLKHQPGSALAPYLKHPQPAWPNPAERVVAIQRRAQAIAPAFVAPVTIGRRAYVLKELMPSQDRLRLEDWNGKPRRLEKAMETMGSLVAWAHLRGGGRQGSAIADQWLVFGAKDRWRAPLMAYVGRYGRRALEDWRRFGEAYQRGLIGGTDE